MSDLDASTPRIFLGRHGETERTKTGQYTGIAGLELTPAGSKRVQDTATQLVGAGKLIDPARVAHGLILRAFVKRWLGCPFDMPLPMMLPPGGIGILSYKNHDTEEPGFFIGMALPFQGSSTAAPG